MNKLSNNLDFNPRSNYLLCIPNRLEDGISFHSKGSLEAELDVLCSSDKLSKETVIPTCELEYALNLIDAHNITYFSTNN